ncbi:hypothetical protein FRC0482_02325 [Corynebacterium diphtheriae]|nr:hypothetical protein FRC0482_02325 [Corynebacterium diphtheriae]
MVDVFVATARQGHHDGDIFVVLLSEGGTFERIGKSVAGFQGRDDALFAGEQLECFECFHIRDGDIAGAPRLC